MKKDNPFYDKHIFTKEDLDRVKITWRDWLFIWILPTYVQLSDGYAWFYKTWQGKIYFVKCEELSKRGG